MLRESGAVGLGVVGGRAFLLVGQVLIAAVAGSAAYGVFSLAVVPVMWISTLTMLGLHHALVRFHHKDSVQDPTADSLFRVARNFVVLSVALGFVGAACLGLVITVTNVGAFSDPATKRAMLIVALAVPAMNCLTIAAYTFRACRSFWTDTLIRNLLRGGLFLLGIILVFLLGQVHSPEAYSWAFAASFYCAGLVAFQRVRARVPRSTSWSAFFPDATRLRFGLWVSGSVLAYEVLVATDRMILGMMSSAQEVGRYAAAALLARQLEALGVILYAVLSPIVARAQPRGDGGTTVPREVRFALWGAVGMALAGWAGITFLGGPVLALLGEDYVGAGPVLVWLAAGYAALLIAAPIGALVQFGGREVYDTLLIVGLAVGHLPISIILTRSFGSTGTAAATAIAFVGLLVGRVWLGLILPVLASRSNSVSPA